MSKQQEKGILLLNEELEQVKASGKIQKLLNFRWELNQRYSELVQLGNELDYKRQYKYSFKAYTESRAVLEILKKLEVLLK